jgi:hypothetical protein
MLCREIFIDPVREDYTVVAPLHQVFSPRYPLTENLAVFARWSNAHGSYSVEVQLRSLEGDVLWQHTMDDPFKAHDPLQIWIVPLYHLEMTIPRPGKYEVVLLASGTEVASDTLLAHLKV